MTVTSIAIIAAWLYLISIDTVWRSYIPGGMALRLLVPTALVFMRFYPYSHRILPMPPVIRYGVVAFALAGGVSVVTGVAPTLSGIKLMLYLAIMLPLLHPALTGHFWPSSEGLWKMAQAGCALLVVCALLRLRNPGGLMLYVNGMGGLAVQIAPLMLFMLAVPLRSRRRLGLIGIGLCVAIALISRGRGSVLAMYVMLSAYYLLGRRRSLLVILTTAAMFLVVALFVMLTSDIDYVQSLIYKGKSHNVIDVQRRLMFLECLQAWLRRPLTGYGFGLSHRVSTDALEGALATGQLSREVGELGSSTLGLLVGGGVLLGASFFMLVCGVLYVGMAAYWSPNTPAPSRSLLRAMIAGLLGFLVSAQSENTLMAPLTSFTLLFWFYAGLVVHNASAAMVHEAAQQVLLRSPPMPGRFTPQTT